MKPLWCGVLLAAVSAIGCGGSGNTATNTRPPGEPKTAQTTALETGAAAIQRKPPLSPFNSYVNGFHFHPQDPKKQVEEHHYCARLNEDIHQCVLFDGNTESAKMTGVEYIVSSKIFATLPPDEKRLWHSHVYEVKSGQLIAPGIPEVAEKPLMTQLINTYGKIWHTWDSQHGATLPTGIPALMMGFTADGQLNPQLLADRDRRFSVSSQEKRKERTDIPTPQKDPGADTWEKGDRPVLEISGSPTKQ